MKRLCVAVAHRIYASRGHGNCIRYCSEIDVALYSTKVGTESASFLRMKKMTIMKEIGTLGNGATSSASMTLLTRALGTSREQGQATLVKRMYKDMLLVVHYFPPQYFLPRGHSSYVGFAYWNSRSAMLSNLNGYTCRRGVRRGATQNHNQLIHKFAEYFQIKLALPRDAEIPRYVSSVSLSLRFTSVSIFLTLPGRWPFAHPV